MATVVLIGVFGAAGCLARYWISGALHALAGTALPFGTLAVNVGGALLIGLITETGMRSTLIPPDLRIGLTVGLLGGFTTFSTFSLETYRLLDEGQHLVAFGNVTANVVLCLFCTWLGIVVARMF